MRPRSLSAFILLALFRLALAAASAQPASTNLPQDVYIWQRTWSPQLRESLAQHAAQFQNIVPLAAEVAWKGNRPQVISVPLDYPLLRSTGCPIGLALRIGPYSGQFNTNAPAAVFLANLAASLVITANSNQLALKELQLDFDCAESKLDGYRLWVETIRRRIA